MHADRDRSEQPNRHDGPRPYGTILGIPTWDHDFPCCDPAPHDAQVDALKATIRNLEAQLAEADKPKPWNLNTIARRPTW